VRCEPGSYSGAEAFICRACASGKYQDQWEATSCDTCPDGSRTDTVTGAKSCVPCTPGTYGHVPATGMCTPCANGQHQHKSGTTACVACGAGNGTTGAATQCVPCGKGTYSHSYGNASHDCVQCAIGKYQNQLGATACVACGPKETSAAGAHMCESSVACPGPDQNVPDAAEKALLVKRSTLTTNTLRLASENVFKSFVTHYERETTPQQSCKDLYKKVMARIGTDSGNSTATRSHPSHFLLAAAVAVFAVS